MKKNRGSIVVLLLLFVSILGAQDFSYKINTSKTTPYLIRGDCFRCSIYTNKSRYSVDV